MINQSNNKYKPFKQCYCKICKSHARNAPKRKKDRLKIANRTFRKQSKHQLKEYILNPQLEIDKIFISILPYHL